MKSIYKIWFAKKGSPPLGGPLNEYRLSLHKIRFPEDKLHLITNLVILSDSQKHYVTLFCKNKDIILIDLEDIEKRLNNASYPDKRIQQALFELATIEANVEKGNLAAASDIIRVLSPAIELGMYMDLDVHKVSDEVSVSPLGFLFNGIIVVEKNRVYFDKINNNIFHLNEEKNPFLPFYIRRKLLEKYRGKDQNFVSDLCRKLIMARFKKEDSYKFCRKISLLLQKNTQSHESPIFIIRRFLNENLAPSSRAYQSIYKILTLMTGPDNFRDSIVKYVSFHGDSLKLTIPILKACRVNIRFQDDEDASWFLANRLKEKEDFLKANVKKIENAYLRYKKRVSCQKSSKEIETSSLVSLKIY